MKTTDNTSTSTSEKPHSIERQQTDESLNVERGKTDKSFDEFKGQTELETDQAVSKNRKEADQARVQRRNSADARTAGGPPEKSVHQDRVSEDTAIEKEREKSDLAMVRERGEKEKLLSQLVGSERKATDKNLSQEREKTDHETAHSKHLLTTRDEFLAIVSHDLRNPIGAILSSVDLLIEDSAVELSQDAKQCLEIIKRSAETSLRLIRDILDMERIAEGKLQLKVEPNNLNQVVQECVESNSHLAQSRKIRLVVVPSKPGSIPFDRDRITQVLSNLISNALKFTPEGGVVTVKTEQTGPEIKVSVTDDGPGIPETQKLQIFERFAQLQNKDRRGLGLGLYISKNLVESHHGKLWVDSNPGKGSSFSFTLPN